MDVVRLNCSSGERVVPSKGRGLKTLILGRQALNTDICCSNHYFLD